MTISALIGLIVGLVSATVLVAGLLLWFYYKKRQTYYEKKFVPEVKSKLEINIKDKKYRIIDFDVNEEGEIVENVKVNWISLKFLQDTFDTLEDKNYFNNSLKVIMSRKKLYEKEHLLAETLGKREKVRYKKSSIIYITAASLIKEEHTITYMIHKISFGREVDTELLTKINTYTEQQIYKKLVKENKGMKNPVLVKISAEPSYTRNTDPTFPPQELIRMLTVWYGLNKKQVYVSKMYDMYILESVPDKIYGSATVEDYYRKIFEKDVKQFKLFSPQLISNINSLKVLPIYVKDLTDYELSYAMVILKMRLSDIEEFKVNSNQYNNRHQRDMTEDKFNEQVQLAIKEIKNLSFRYDDEVLSGNKTLLRPDISSKNLYFIYNFTASLKEDLLKKMKEVLEGMKLKKSMYIEMDWLLYWVYMESNIKIKGQIIVTYSSLKYGLSFWNEMFLDKVSKYNEKTTLLIKNIDSNYEDILKLNAFDTVIISSYARKEAEGDVHKDVELAKIKELARTLKIKLIC